MRPEKNPIKDLLPIVDQKSPAAVDNNRAREIQNTLHAEVRRYIKDQERVRNLVTFADRVYTCKNAYVDETRVDPVSVVRHGDRPEIELYLKHRDSTKELEEIIASVRSRLKEIDFNQETLQEIHKLVEKLDKVAGRVDWRMHEMRTILTEFSKEQGRLVASMTKLATDSAKLAQSALQHNDKMEIAREVARPPSAEDLIEKIAAKHGMTKEQAIALLGAKTVEATKNDGE